MSEAAKTDQKQEEEKTIPCSSSTTFTSSDDDDDDDHDDAIGGAAASNRTRGKKNKELDLSFDLATSCVASAAATPGKLSDANALKLYGFYKQALEGDCLSSKPAIWDRKGRAKWCVVQGGAGTIDRKCCLFGKKKRFVSRFALL